MAVIRVGEVFDTGGGHRHRIDAGRDGSIVVISTQEGNYLSRIGEDGAVVSLAPAPSNGNFRSGEVDTLSDGRYVVSAGGHAGFGSGALVQILNRDGSAATGQIDAMVDDAARYGPGFTVTGANDGGFAFVWNDFSAGSAQYQVTHSGAGPANVSGASDVRIRYFDATGSGGLSTVADEDVESLSGATASRRAADQYINDTETLAGGQTVFAYMDNRIVGSPDGGGSHSEWELSVQIATPGNVGEPIKADLGSYNEQFGQSYPQAIDPAAGVNVVAMAEGGFAVIWTENAYVPADVWGGYSPSGWNTLIRYFDAAGNALTDAITIVSRGTTHGNHSKYVWAEALSDGRIAIAYNVGTSGSNGNGTLDAFVGRIGPLGSSVEVARANEEAATNTQFYTISDLAVRTDDSLELVYTDARTGADGYANHTVIERFAVADSGEVVQTGGADAESFAGGGLDDVLFGLGGNDVAQGRAGRDSLHGGEGNDWLKGGLDGDRIFGGAGNDRLEGEAGADRIDGGAGLDRVSYAGSDAGVQVRLQLGTATGGHAAGDVLSDIENLSGSGWNDTLIGDGGVNRLEGLTGDDLLDGLEGDDTLHGALGNDLMRGRGGVDTIYGGAGNDRIFGGAGNDIIQGDAGIDALIGEAGADKFFFRNGDTSAHAHLGDRITGFSRAEGDKIQLRQMDADANTGGDQNFAFIGADAFSGKAGELRYEVANGHAYLQGDTNGDGAADFYIRVENTANLIASDIIA